MCEKDSFRNRTAAVAAARGRAKRMKQALHAYLCDLCGMIHLSTNRKENHLRHPKKEGKYPLKVNDYPIKSKSDT